MPVDLQSESENPIKIYLREIGETPLLSAEEEKKLANFIKAGRSASKHLEKLVEARHRAQSKKTGRQGKFSGTKAVPDRKKIAEWKKEVELAQSARQTMIKANLRLVVKIAQDYANYGLPLLDLISEGNIGLIKAVERFDTVHGAKLSTFAAWWIKQSIKRALANQGKTIRLPVHLTDKITRMRRISGQLTEEFGRDPTDNELAEELHISADKVGALRRASLRPTSLNSAISEDEDSSELGDIVGDEGAVAPDDAMEKDDLSRYLTQILRVLNDRERNVLTMRFGLDGRKEQTLEEVGQQFHVTRERIRQIQSSGLTKLKRALERSDKSASSRSV
jgi:RNA polymerase primary sigma factor